MNLLLQKYRILGKKGEGTFSEVLKVQNIKDGTYRACKKMKQSYDSIEQVNNLREIQAMRRLSPHANVLELFEIIFDKKSGTLVLICELMDMNIYELIRGKRHYLPERKVKHYMYQLMKSIDHVHRNGIFHRDVKPENILIRDDLLKLADFGSCRSVYSKQPYTEYISTRWYRAPECLLTDGYYTYKMDLWSVGCVFFEILSLHPLFPGANEVDQIAKIHDIMGTPEPAVLSKLKRSRGMSFNFPPKKGSGIERLLPHVSQEAIELIYQLCTYDPDDRITARQALKHHYFKEFRDMEKKATSIAKQRHLQESVNAVQENASVDNTDGSGEKLSSGITTHDVTIATDQQHSPTKAELTEITMYPTIPKAQSLPLHSQTLKERKRRRNKRQTESHGYMHHTGLLPRVPMHQATFNPTFHSTSFSAAFNKLADGAGSTALLPTISNAYKPHKATAAKTSKSFLSSYTLPSLDRHY
ncbi:MAPK/MAK/MRK overlapping kinase-like isoform X2 [Pomacea canaliculata]|uniref:MAPK/MAK/MRK overlapping kinase-like isoform X2 n=1 Tax=Pomacea canaliculata TaxID=400727 RepID=UPI000D726617|nr:MAPK/MAK/MRK overlapping kinase-like isoform X2 [Pomacea canaliculata]